MWLRLLKFSKREYVSYEEAKQWAIDNNINTVAEWHAANKPKSLPSIPRNIYPEFTSWSEFFNKRKNSGRQNLKTYDEVRQWVLDNKIRNINEYQKRYKEHPEGGLPSQPQRVYLDFNDRGGYDFFFNKKNQSSLSSKKNNIDVSNVDLNQKNDLKKLIIKNIYESPSYRAVTTKTFSRFLKYVLPTRISINQNQTNASSPILETDSKSTADYKKLNQSLNKSLAYKSIPIINISSKPIDDNSIYNHFELQNEQCFFCGRVLFNTVFKERDIQIEHLVPKSVFIGILRKCQNLIYLILSKGSDINKVKNDISTVKSILNSNIINGLENYALCDAQCNYSKMTMDYKSYINFMSNVAEVNFKKIISSNNTIRSKSSKYKETDLNHFKSAKIKSYELILEQLVKALVSVSGDERYLEMLPVSWSNKSNIQSDIHLCISIIEKTPNFSSILENINLEQLKTNLNINNCYDAVSFESKKKTITNAELCSCVICGEQINKNNYLVMDITAEYGTPMFELVHNECSRSCAGLPFVHFKNLSLLIKNFTPQREGLIIKMGINIEKYYLAIINAQKNLEKFINSSIISEKSKQLANMVLKFIKTGSNNVV